jgi:hypothetical protein
MDHTRYDYDCDWTNRRKPCNDLLAIKMTNTGAEPVNLADFKAHARITHSDDDAYIPLLLKTARRSIEKYTGLSLLAKTIQVHINNEAGGYELPYGPVVSISSVKDKDGNAITGYTTSGIDFKVIDSAYSFMDITYLADISPLPDGEAESLKTAIKHEALFLYEHRGDAVDDNKVNSVTARAIAKAYRRIMPIL